MTNYWQIWFMRPEWMTQGRFYDERPDPKNLLRTHTYVGQVPDKVPEMHVLRDYKEYVFNMFSPRKPKPDEMRPMAWGDVMISPQGDVWHVELWGFEFLGPDPAPRLHSPMYTVEDVRWAQRPGGPGLPVIRLHHQANEAPPPKDNAPII
jgi:hypothetical protein